ncbi:Fic family protein [Bradyrhizobium macuxiense]|uniref:Fic family protein n=1 Tax=Bradyrhizobium macuxiense TaxID=1755647 RepID=UPI0009E8B80A
MATLKGRSRTTSVRGTRILPRSWRGRLPSTMQQKNDLDPVIAAAVLAFRFFYIHPFEDGVCRRRLLLHSATAPSHWAASFVCRRLHSKDAGSPLIHVPLPPFRAELLQVRSAFCNGVPGRAKHRLSFWTTAGLMRIEIFSAAETSARPKAAPDCQRNSRSWPA